MEAPYHQDLLAAEASDEENDWDFDISIGTSAVTGMVDNTSNIVPLHSLLVSSVPAIMNSDAMVTDQLEVRSVSVSAEDSVGAFCCQLCSYTCDNKAILRNHTEKHSYTETLSCVYCSYKTINEVHFARHISDHEIEKQAIENAVGEPEPEDDWQVYYTGPEEDSCQPSTDFVFVKEEPHEEAMTVEPIKRKSVPDFSTNSSAPKKSKMSHLPEEFEPKVDIEHSVLATTRMYYKKWRCSACDFNTKDIEEMDEHLLIHNGFEGFSEHSIETAEGNNRTSEVNDRQVPHPERETRGDDKGPCQPSNNAKAIANPIENIVIKSEKNSENSSALETYTSRDNTSENITSCDSRQNGPIKSKQIIGMTMKCPFCPTVSPGLIAHENHIKLYHINETEEAPQNDNSPRVSSRPSTSRFKRAPNQQHDSATSKSAFNDSFTDLSDEEFDEPPAKKVNNNAPFTKKISTVGRHASIPKGLSQEERPVKVISRVNGKFVRPKLTAEEMAKITIVCPICPYKTFIIERFTAHMRKLHKNAVVYPCNYCAFCSLDKNECSRHRSNCGNHTRIPLCCPLCFCRTNYYRSFLRHAKCCLTVMEEDGFHLEGDHACVFCKYSTHDLECFKKHLLNHVRSEKLTCPKCQFETCRKDMYRLHLTMEHNIVAARKMSCAHCTYTTTKQNLLEKHIKYNHTTVRKLKKAPAINTYLDENEDASGSDTDHEYTEEAYETDEVAGSSGVDEDLKDEVDFRRVTQDCTSDDFDQDQDKCTPKKKQSSKPSGAKSSFAKSNTKSAKTASPKRKNSITAEFICLFCSKKCDTRIGLERHAKIHACEGVFTCPMCNFSSAHFTLLKSHFKSCHPEVVF
ncbi:zinc finger Y-chromosomal protein 2-like [Hyalella azteca]|uniref:Zinc finger Y-chromosomal protein 2-like n=1 Tax=Hyalella azteca TaxID=294128 RepID=A0A8B7NES9_HYAAZ|nr:zinc finger Y-chromosomal protein 2-like [Hyalella azteca]XP_018012131.1 zinc finger Y-chromosomal protein 2-like [Hyalella azteca]